MRLRTESCLLGKFMLLLLLQHCTAANLAQHLKSLPQQQAQQKTPPPPQQQQPQQPALSNSMANQQQQEQPHQYGLEKEVGEDDYNDPYQILTELKQPETRFPFWNPYNAAAQSLQQQQSLAQQMQQPNAPLESLLSNLAPSAKLLPFFGYGPPVLVPYPFFFAPEMFYPGNSFGGNTNHLDFEENIMGRAATGRRPPVGGGAANGGGSYHHRNSPIYYVRTSLPPTPYMLVPSLGYTPMSAPQLQQAYGSPFTSSFLPFQSLPNFPTYSSVVNLPVNFVSNGRTSGIYQIGGSPTDLQSGSLPHFSSYPSATGPRPLPPSLSHAFRPSSQSYNIGPPTQDSKLLSLKRPYFFNGRAEDIYILPNNFNPLHYTDSGYY